METYKVEKGPGRPKKKNAKKAGDLQKGLIRVSFIANEDHMNKIRKLAEKYKLSIKDIMEMIMGRVDENSLKLSLYERQNAKRK